MSVYSQERLLGHPASHATAGRMNPERWHTLRALFDELIELPSDERTVRIEAANLDDEMQAELQALLEADEAPAELLGATFAGKNQLFNPLTYVFLVCMLISIFTQLHFLAKALAWFDALYVVPVFMVCDSQFGKSVSVSGISVVVGAWHDDDDRFERE